MTPEQIRNARSALGLSQEQFAAALGVSFVTVNRWEMSKARPSAKHVREVERLSKGWQVAGNGSPGRASLMRPIHYLGSKLRLADIISRTIEEVAPGQGAVCDLFAGSGTVSLALAANRPVVSVDIQEYSRVLTSALLSPVGADGAALSALVSVAQEGSRRSSLHDAMAPLIQYEQACMESARRGDVEPLCDLVEYGSLFIHQVEGQSRAPEGLRIALEEASSRLAAEDSLGGAATLACRYFGGIYFSYAQAADLDALLDVAHGGRAELRDVALAAVLSTASEIVNTVGKQFAQPIKLRNGAGLPKQQLINQTLRDRTYDVMSLYKAWLERYCTLERPENARHTVLRADYRDFLSTYNGGLSCVYADPPYTRDHYSRFYHVLETLCLRDLPAVSAMRKRGELEIMRGLYRVERHQSPFCIKSQAKDAFLGLFEGARRFEAPLVLSYSPFNAADDAHPRLMAVDDISQLAHRFYRNVEVRSVGRFAHSKLNAEWLHKRAAEESEVLIVCQP
jgi:adenine-specific DNA methylase/DNA-binding XRE family transcriptional regulator